MRRAPSLLSALVAAALVAPAAPAVARPSWHHDRGTRLVVRTSGDAEAVAERLSERVPGAAVQSRRAATTVVTVPAARVAAALEALDGDPAVVYAEADPVATVATTDPRYAQQWGLARTSVPSVWTQTAGDPGTIVAVIDTGVDTANPDLAGARFVAGYDFVNDDTDPADDHGHGTGAAGVVVAQPDNGVGGVGVCPRCSVMPLKALGDNGSGYHSDIAAALRWAVDHGASVVNLSLGSEETSHTLREAVAYAAAAGATVVAAAGNAGVTTVTYPAGYADALGVAGSDQQDNRYRWSNSGDWVALAAPGCNWSAWPSGQQFCGTSSATPFVAGIAGLLRSARPAATADEIAAALRAGTVSVDYVAAGRVDAAAALAALRAGPTAPVPAEPTGAETPAPSASDVKPVAPTQPPPAQEPLPPTEDPPPPHDVVAPPVATVATLAADATTVPVGRPARLRGRVRPAVEGLSVQLQHRTSRGWRTLAHATPVGERVGFDVRVGRPGLLRYRLRVLPGDTWSGSTSAAVRVVAVRPRVVAVKRDRRPSREYVVVRNTGTTVLDLEGWKLRARRADRTFTLDAYRLRPGASVRVHTGRGTTGPRALYLGRRASLWRAHDTAVLRAPSGAQATRASW